MPPLDKVVFFIVQKLDKIRIKGMIVKNLNFTEMFTDIIINDFITHNPDCGSDEEIGQSLTDFLEEKGRLSKRKILELADKLKKNYSDVPAPDKEEYITIELGGPNSANLRKNWIRQRGARDE